MASIEFPPGFCRRNYYRAPQGLRDDALQEAWLAVADGRNPNTSFRNFLLREYRHTGREIASRQAQAAVAVDGRIETLICYEPGRKRRGRRDDDDAKP